MLLLLAVSFIWACSFGLIKGRLAGLDPAAVAVVRLAVALLVFLPLIRRRGAPARLLGSLAGVGAVQFGFMYVAYLGAFQYLQAYEVALFTIFTPLYLALMDAALERRWQPRHLVAALLAVAGAGVVLWTRAPGSAAFTGFLLVQGSNLCFAAGQLLYRRLRPAFPTALSDIQAFGWLMLGALAATLLASAPLTDWSSFRPTVAQGLVLLYLGAVATGAGFFLWNRGALQVNAGTLAAFNNAKVPLAIACSLIFFKERADLPRLAVSLVLLTAAILVAERSSRRP